MKPIPRFSRRAAGPSCSLATLATLTLFTGQPIRADLVHRWSFDIPAGAAADGVTVPDSIGGSGFQAVVRGSGATFTGTAVRLPGGGSGTAPYIDLPNNLIGAQSPIVLDGKNTVTLEGWVTVQGPGNAWARFLDMGNNTAGEILAPGGSFSGVNYLIYSAATGTNYDTQQLELNTSAAGGAVSAFNPNRPGIVGRQVYFAITVDSSSGSSLIDFYRDGEHIVTSQASNALLEQVDDVNNWLGRSNYASDANLNGEFNEFRIYDHILTPEEIYASRASGPSSLVVDTDGDGMPDGWETLHGLNVGTNDSAGDADGDLLTNVLEFQRGTDPQVKDTDGDGLTDFVETNTGVYTSVTNTGTDPLNPDTDRDGLLDAVENASGTYTSPTSTGTDPFNRDTDGDGAGDATEVRSASDPTKIADTPLAKLDHRYSFAETSGHKVADSLGGAPGWIHATGFSQGGGELTLNGGNPNTSSYVSLPAGLISNYGAGKGGKGAVTIEGWATVLGTDGGDWGRLVDFGNSDPGGVNGAVFGVGNWNGGGTAAIDTFFLSGYNGLDATKHQISLRKADGTNAPAVQFDITTTSVIGGKSQFALTFDESSGVLRYFEDGFLVGESVSDPLNPIRLGALKDVNNWLGRSNFTVDGNLHASYDELRIYDGVLTDDQIAADFTKGPDGAAGGPDGAADTDGDGIPDWFERANGLNPAVNDAAADPDGDGVTNLKEYQRGSSPALADTDGDGLSDAAETGTGIFASAADTGTSPAAFDSDGDFASDNAEVLAGTSPVDSSSKPATLLHRWSFNGAAAEAPDGTATMDSVSGEANAIVRGDGGQLTGGGISIPGGGSASAAYVDLPNGLVSPLKSVTIEMWVSVRNDSNAWARFFDFGNTLASEGAGKEITGPGDNGNGGDYLFLSAANGTNYGLNRMEFREASPGPVASDWYENAVTFTADQQIYLVAMVDSSVPGTSHLTLWRDGVPVYSNLPVPRNLAGIDDVNCWLGRSNWTGDANLAGTYDEVRIYDGTLTAAEVAQSLLDGPDADIGPPVDSGFQITSVSALPGQPLSFSFPTEAGATYQAETSTNLAPLASWTSLGGVISGTGSPATVTDSTNGVPSTTGGKRFYRVRRLP